MGILYWTFFIVVCHVTTIYFSMCCAIIYVLFIKLRQNGAVLEAIYRTKNLSKYKSFRKLHVSTWSLLFQANKCFGKMFLVCLLAFCPISAVLTILLTTTDTINATQMPFIVGFIAYENIFVFAVHLILTLCSQRLHSTGQTLLRLMHLGRRKKMTKGRHFRIKLQLMADISAVVTERKIGFTYGAYGLISLYAFSKYIMLYGKALMLSRKMIQENRLYNSVH